jgi:hypothetical protein
MGRGYSTAFDFEKGGLAAAVRIWIVSYDDGGMRASRNALSMTASDSHIPDDRRFIMT